MLEPHTVVKQSARAGIGLFDENKGISDAGTEILNKTVHNANKTMRMDNLQTVRAILRVLGLCWRRVGAGHTRTCPIIL